MSENAKGESYVELACHYIEEHYMCGIGVADVAAYIAIDRTYLYRLFIDEKGVSPSKYLQNVRLEHSRKLLEQGEIPISDVHLYVGFMCRARFVTKFKRAFGESPAEYVKKRNG